MENNLKTLRLERGLTQEALADKIGTNAGQIHKLESGMRRLSDVWIEKLMPALGCSPAELIGGAPEKQVPIIGEVPGGDLIEAIHQPADGFIRFNSKKPNLVAVRVRGNSMSRIAPDGMYVIVDIDDNNPANLANQPVIVCIDCDGAYECSFKIYKRNPDRFEPFSIEAGYDAIFPGDRPWKIYGRVIGAVGYIGAEAKLIEEKIK
jgi:SOS-response transcriptional repressor LexA